MRKELVVTVSILLTLLIGCSVKNIDPEKTGNQEIENQVMVNQETNNQKEDMPEDDIDIYGKLAVDGNKPIKDNMSLYDNDSLDVEVMYLTVQKGNESDGTNHTWEEINSNSAYYYEEMNVDRYKVDAILQVGDENGPVMGEFGYESLVPNATVAIRGQTSTRREQKNYKIKIKDGKGSYKEQTTINLNKHVGDSLRFRNKLCYDLMKNLPEMMSARTQFVHLYVKDLTENADAEFVDYGLYTQVEQINKNYLKLHGLDSEGHLYKINYFEFYQYEDVIKLSSDAEYDEKKFEEYLEIKGNKDHRKLIEMLADVNDYTKSIEEVFSKWFDEDNVFSWLAFHILVGNKDTQSRNVFIYSPLNIDKWYFISWDNDVAFNKLENELNEWEDGNGWETGISNYWGNILFKRILKSPEHLSKLDAKIEEYKKIITEDKINEMASEYNAVVEPYIKRLPDIEYLPLTLSDRQYILNNFAKEVENNYQEYKLSLEKPQPFYISTPEITANGISFSWEMAYDFDEEDVTYSVEVSDDYSFTNLIYEADDLYALNVDVNTQLEPGQYFIRVIAKNESGYEQYAFDRYIGLKGNVYGVKCFYIQADGSVVEDIIDERE